MDKMPCKLNKLSLKMGRLGFEPRTNRLKAEYSTVELATLENLRTSRFFPRMIIIAQVFCKNPNFSKLSSFLLL